MRRYIEQRASAGDLARNFSGQAADGVRAAAVAEPHRLVRDLHDSASQTLFILQFLQFAAEAAANRWDTEPALAREALDIVRHLATCATTEMRGAI